MFFYRVFITLFWLPVAALLFVRVLRGKERLSDWLERIGIGRVRGRSDHVWVHAASNGELASARPVLLALLERHPQLRVLITTNSVGGRALARSWEIEGLTARLAPLDTRWSARRLLSRYRVKGLIIIESEFWPNRIAAVSNRGLPVIVLGARLSRKSARVWRRLAHLARALQSRITYLSPQDNGSRRRFLRLGATQAQMGPVLDLKAFYEPFDGPEPDAALTQVFVPQTTWLAASTHAGEDEIVLEAHQRLKRDWPELQLIIAPRHPDRGADIAMMARNMGFDAAVRSAKDAPRPDAIYVADTLGEMPLWYQCAGVTFVGGSLVDKGGHTPFEPAAFDNALLHGPHVSNFKSIYGKLDVSGAAIKVEDATTLHNAVLHLRESDHRAAMLRLAGETLDQPAQLDEVLTKLQAALGASLGQKQLRDAKNGPSGGF